MAFIPCAGVTEVAFIGRYQGQDFVTVQYVKKTGGVAMTLAEVTSVAERSLIWWESVGRTLRNASFSMTKIAARALDTDTSPYYEVYPSVGNQAGTRGGLAYLGGTAGCITKQTGVPGRSYRGRTYEGGFVTADVSGAKLTDGYVINLAAGWKSWSDGIKASSSGFFWVVLSRRHNGAPRTVGVGTEAKHLFVDTAPDSQRRRLLGRGA